MGASESQPDLGASLLSAAAAPQLALRLTYFAGSGYRCLRVMKNSPACKAGLVSFFDFIVSVNDIPLQQHDGTFASLIAAHQG